MRENGVNSIQKGKERMKKRTIDAGTARMLAVKAQCDPKTIIKVLKNGGEAETISAKRALEVLIESGRLPRPKAD
jgi:Icc-related predicted phosphoesterase